MLNNKPSFPQLNNNIETDVLIIGGGITGAISAYIFNEKNIKVALIERENLLSESNHEMISDIDIDLNNISKYVSKYDKLNFFRFTLDTLYKLEDITKKQTDNCNFVRKPALNYKNEVNKINSCFKFPFYSDNLTYNCGAEVDSVKLTKELYKYCINNDIHVYENTEAFEFDFKNDDIEVITKSKNKIKCKNVLIVNRFDSQLFFDKPTNNNELYKNKTIVELKFSKKTIGCSHNNLMESSNSIDKIYKIIGVKNIKKGYCLNGMPYICKSEEYPNVYFNLNNNCVLYALMGAMSLLDVYLGLDECFFNILCFSDKLY